MQTQEDSVTLPDSRIKIVGDSVNRDTFLLSANVTTIRCQGDIMEGENSIIEQIIKEMIDGVIIMDTGQGEENDQARATECHAVAALAHSMVGMALEAATTPVSVVADNTNCGERDSQ